MPSSIRHRRFGLVGTLVLAAFSLVALSVPLRPAKAQCLGVDLGVVCAGLGVPSAFSYRNPYYNGYPYPPYAYPGPYPAYSYSYPYYNPYYPYP
jgi:uncharacterized membrane protein